MHKIIVMKVGFYYKKYDIRQLLVSSALIGCILFHPLFRYPNNNSFTIADPLDHLKFPIGCLNKAQRTCPIKHLINRALFANKVIF